MFPVHVLVAWVAGQEVSATSFGHTGTAGARAKLKRRLRATNVVDATSYKLHDFRSGHAQEMASPGCSLAAILSAGEWTSAAFMAYM